MAKTRHCSDLVKIFKPPISPSLKICWPSVINILVWVSLHNGILTYNSQRLSNSRSPILPALQIIAIIWFVSKPLKIAHIWFCTTSIIIPIYYWGSQKTCSKKIFCHIISEFVATFYECYPVFKVLGKVSKKCFFCPKISDIHPIKGVSPFPLKNFR